MFTFHVGIVWGELTYDSQDEVTCLVFGLPAPTTSSLPRTWHLWLNWSRSRRRGNERYGAGQSWPAGDLLGTCTPWFQALPLLGLWWGSRKHRRTACWERGTWHSYPCSLRSTSVGPKQSSQMMSCAPWERWTHPKCTAVNFADDSEPGWSIVTVPSLQSSSLQQPATDLLNCTFFDR